MADNDDSDVEMDGVDMEADDAVQEEEEDYEEAAPAAGAVVKERLANMKEFGTTMEGVDVQQQRDKRLNYLMAQSEVFSHFMEENSDGGFKRAKAKAGRTRMTESAEDANLMKTAQSKLRVTRVQTQPSIITAKMRPYQLEGLNWLVKLHDNGINGILADEMGLGKTLQSISLLAYLHETRGITGPHICIVPKSVTNNWMRELRKWCPTLRPVKLLGSKDERARVLREDLHPGTFDVLVTSYEGILKEKAGLMKIQWQYLLIGGAPHQEPEFVVDNVVKLHTVLRPFMLRRIKKDVEKDLPPKREVKLYIGMTEMQRLWYTKILSRTHTLNARRAGRVQLLNILMQLRKVCNHPYLFEGAEPGPPFMDGPHLWENTGKLMTRMLDILEDYMRLNQYKYCRIDGSTSGDDRDSQMDVFNAPGSEKFAFLLSTRAGGLGINLATADIVVLYDSDWNPQVDLQAMDRAHRIGQTKPVTVFRFVTEGTVEEKIIERADRKLFLDAAVIQQGRLAEQNAALGKNDLMAMVRFGADEIFASKAKTITDEDIDTLLKRGEERTQEQASKIQSDVQHNLANFSLTTMEEPEGSLFNFEGENYKGAKGGGGLMINLPQRERKRNYDVDEYFRDALRQGDKPAVASRGRRARRCTTSSSSTAELEVLLAKEDELAGKKHEAVLFIKELRNRAKQQEDDDCEESKRADEMEATLETAYELPVKKAVRKERLLKEGFGDWTRKDLRAFLNAMERHGRGDVDAVARETANETGKTDADVRRYHATFWKKHKDIADWERLVDKVEKGEKRLQRSQEIRSAFADKVARHPKPWECLPINYGASRGKVWTEEEDAFLFNFDWFFKSRNAQELNRRADLLIRLVEKENEDHRKDAPGAAPAGDVAAAPAKKGRKPAGRPKKRAAEAATGESPDAKQAKQGAATRPWPTPREASARPRPHKTPP
ncbi:helicase [Aureococcus anophagefferens]|nr:helicase [Aureococcus anophagefferens]